jgi:hypothetical protein
MQYILGKYFGIAELPVTAKENVLSKIDKPKVY